MLTWISPFFVVAKYLESPVPSIAALTALAALFFSPKALCLRTLDMLDIFSMANAADGCEGLKVLSTKYKELY